MLVALEHGVQLPLLINDPGQRHLLNTVDRSTIYEVAVLDVGNPQIMLFFSAVAPGEVKYAHVQEQLFAL